ncbi:hypothetical protein [Bacillus cereus]|uniref:hypothetical protein n=1 Tax=Bacillus cereus TaxID=1396 RepID=UPI001A2D6A02|nr:hypothetical protein [Bacillus cereus]
MSSNDDKLNTQEKIHLGIEACLQLIPNIGGAIATSFYGYQKEKKLKRIESFYNELQEDLTTLKTSLQDSATVPDMDELLRIIEDLNEKVEREHIKEKQNYFKTYFINNILHPNQVNYDDKKFFLDTLANMTLVECNSILYLYTKDYGVIIDNVTSGTTNKFQKLGAMHRLESYGFIEMTDVDVKDFSDNYYTSKYVSITNYGKKFVNFCLQNY